MSVFASYPGIYAEEKLIPSDYSVLFNNDDKTGKKLIVIKFGNNYEIKLEDSINVRFFGIKDNTNLTIITLNPDLKNSLEKIVRKNDNKLNINLDNIWQLSLSQHKVLSSGIKWETLQSHFTVSYKMDNQKPVLNHGFIHEYILVHDRIRNCAHHKDDMKIRYP